MSTEEFDDAASESTTDLGRRRFMQGSVATAAGALLPEQLSATDARATKATASLPKLVAFREWLLTQASDDTRHLEGLAGPQPGQRRNAGRQPTRKQNARQSSANAKS